MHAALEKSVHGLFTYDSVRVVRIHSKTLGVIQITCYAGLVCLVVLYQIGYLGRHFEVHAIQGSRRVSIQHPTAGHCNPYKEGCHSNFADFSTLPYCEQSILKLDPSKRPTGKDMHPKHCDYFDAPGMGWINGQPGSSNFFIPTLLQAFNQTTECSGNFAISAASDCNKQFDFVEFDPVTKKAKPFRETYLGDIEKYTLLFGHSYSDDSKTNMGHEEWEMQGYWMDCEREILDDGRMSNRCEKKPMLCQHDDCDKTQTEKGPVKQNETLPQSAPDITETSMSEDTSEGRLMRGRSFRRLESDAQKVVSRGETNDEQWDEDSEESDRPLQLIEGTVVSMKRGDVMSLKHLLYMAGINSLDETHPARPGSKEPGERFRDAGLTLEIFIHYTNRKPWFWTSGTSLPFYTLKSTLRPSTKFSFRYTEPNHANNPYSSSRILYRWHGINLMVTQTGETVDFSFMKLCMVLTAALALLKFIRIFLDVLASQLPGFDALKKKKYEMLDLSPDLEEDLIGAPAN